MKKLSLIAIAIFISSISFFKSSSQSVRIIDRFNNFYNEEKYDSIFAMFSTEMKKALPWEKTKEFLEGLKTNYGKITNKEFLRYLDGRYASYKTQFEKKGFLCINFATDNDAKDVETEDDYTKITGLFIKPYVPENLPKINRNLTKLVSPFEGEWTVLWGGDTKELNYHIISQAQKNAFDFLIQDALGKSFKTDGKTNENYYAFGKPILAPCEAEVIMAVDGIKDNQPGVMNPSYTFGNSVILKTSAGEYMVFAHLKQFTVAVKQGQKLKPLQQIGLCGNSGNSTEPHLHFHIQNFEYMNNATGVKSYFNQVVVNGELKSDYSPIKGDKIKAK